MAFEQPSDREVQAFERAVFPERLESVLGTGRSESARWRSERGDALPVEHYKEDEREDGYLPDSIPKCFPEISRYNAAAAGGTD